MAYIHEQKDWPKFRWNIEELSPFVANIRHKQGLLLGRMSAIEGENLDPEQVLSSIAKRLGVDISGTATTNRHVDGYC